MSFSPDPIIVAVGFERLMDAGWRPHAGCGRNPVAPERQIIIWPDPPSEVKQAVKSMDSSISNF